MEKWRLFCGVGDQCTLLSEARRNFFLLLTVAKSFLTLGKKSPKEGSQDFFFRFVFLLVSHPIPRGFPATVYRDANPFLSTRGIG